MAWHTSPPEASDNYPTLLFSWWATIFAAGIILLRLCGRKVRTNVLFREDKIMALSLVPLFVRMALVHVVLLDGTNNVAQNGLEATQLDHRAVGSRLVLVSRIFYAMLYVLALDQLYRDHMYTSASPA